MNSASDRSVDRLKNLPPTTLGVLAICVSVFAIESLLGWNLRLFTMCPRSILYVHEYYRIFTAVFFHSSLFHLGTNMLSAFVISGALEKQLGTLRLLFSIWWAILLTSAIYMLVAYIAYAVVGYDTWMYGHAVGYSGILFHLSVLESRLVPGRRSVFGYFSVPAPFYPWVLLLLLQFIIPNISFLGHLAGILNGTLEYYGVWNNVLFVEDSFLVYLESLPMARRLVALDGFVGISSSVVGQRWRAEQPSPFASSLRLSQPNRNVVRIVSEFAKDILRTMLVRTRGWSRRIVSNNTRSSFQFWKRRTRSTSKDTEHGATILPPEYYDGRMYENDSIYDDDDEEEINPIVSQTV